MKKYTITLTAEDLQDIIKLDPSSIGLIVNALKDRLEGGQIVMSEKLQPYFKKLESLMTTLQEVPEDKVNLAKTVIAHLNKRLSLEGRKGFKHNSIPVKKHISARMNEGYILEDFLEVIDKKCDEWVDTEHEKYLRPETLFGNKFSGYLAQKSTVKSVQTAQDQSNINYEEGI